MPVTPLTLIRLEGPDDPLVGGRIVLEREAAVGRAVQADLCLPDPSVSRRHAVLRPSGGVWFLTDEASTTGTTLNTRRLPPGEPAPLEPGDRVGIGPWLFRVGEESTATRAVGLTIDGPAARAPLSTRRLDALSACLDAMERASDPGELAEAVLRAAMDGTGFGRAAVLLPGTGHQTPELLAGLTRAPDGSVRPIDPDAFAPFRSLVEQARAGQLAVHAERPDAAAGGTGHDAHSIAELAIHSAVCAPVTPDGRVAAMLYLDARSGDSPVSSWSGGLPAPRYLDARSGEPVRDAAGYLADVARLYAFALTRDAQADLRRRQAALRIELERARELRAMLAPPPLARCGAYRHASRTIAGMFVSADLFDAIAHPDGSVTALFGDASGHGVGAAMLAALVQSHLASALASGASVEGAVVQTNRFVATRPTGGRFVSLVAARLGPDGSVRLVDAGHGHWMLARREADPDHAGRPGSCPLGVDPDARFDAVTRRLGPGDRLLCYTDGIPDQAGPDGAPFGLDRLHAAVRASRDCETDVSGVFDALQRHAGARALDDDATVASVQFDPA